MSVSAFVLVLAAAAAHAAWNIIAHGVSRLGIPFLWCGAVASTAVWLVAVPLTGGLGTDDLVGFGVGIAVSAVMHVVYMLVLQRGYAFGSLTTVYATARGVGPLISVVAAIVLLGERLDAIALVGVVLVIVGVVAVGFIDRPAGQADARRARIGLVFGVMTGVMIAVYTVWDAFAIRQFSISPIAYMVGCTLIEIPLYTAVLGRRLPEVVPIVRVHWRRLLGFGALSPLAYILVLTAVQVAPVALVAPVREVSVIMVSLYGAFVLRETRPGHRLAASGIVVTGIVLLAV